MKHSALSAALTIDRIEYLVDDADYPDSQAAIEDSWRVALLAVSRRAAREHDLLRQAVFRASAQHPTGATTGWHRGTFIAALVLGMVAVALVTVSPRTGGAALSLQSGMLPAGLLAACSVGVLAWLEPRRASGALWGSHASARIHLVLAVVWLLFCTGAILFRWDETDRHQPLPVIAGVVLFVMSSAAALVLWYRGRVTARSGQPLRANSTESADVGGQDPVFTELDQWWAKAGPEYFENDHEKVISARRSVLAYLHKTLLITERDRRRALRESTPPPWRERRR